MEEATHPPSRPCPLCAAQEPVAWLRKGALHLVRCRPCGMTYLDPLPEDGGDAYYDRLGRPYYLSPDKLEGDYSPVRFERECALLRRHCPGGTVLDVGCGTGGFLHQLRVRCGEAYRLAGVEVSRAALDHARGQGLRVIDDAFLDHDFGGERFDAVTFWAVLEHLADPAAFVLRAAELLAPGGHALALVPNARSLAMRLLGIRYRYVLPQHVNYFTRDTLNRLMSRAGLEVVAKGGSHFNPVVLWQDARRGSDALVPDAERGALLRRTTRLKQSPWLRPARWMLTRTENVLAALGLADNIWVVSRKPV